MTLGLGACSTFVPASLGGNDFADVTPHMAQHNPEVLGQRVRWGGSIANVTSAKDHTCFQVVSHPLGYSARPEEDDNTNGRFIACIAGFYDPEIYAVKRQITVIGTLQTPTIGNIGHYRYIFPNVDIETIYLWPKPSAIANTPAYEFGPNPFMYQADPWLTDPMDPMNPLGPMDPMAGWDMPW
ncbi:MAG: Slp family lipoprotein [Burkholderiales bacterium]